MKLREISIALLRWISSPVGWLCTQAMFIMMMIFSVCAYMIHLVLDFRHSSSWHLQAKVTPHVLNYSCPGIQYYWIGVRGTQKLNYKTLHSFISWSFCREQGSIKSPLATVSMNNAPQARKTLGELLYLCRLLTLIHFFLTSGKKTPLSVVSLTVHA